jgi:hypothetical protein
MVVIIGLLIAVAALYIKQVYKKKSKHAFGLVGEKAEMYDV